MATFHPVDASGASSEMGVPTPHPDRATGLARLPENTIANFQKCDKCLKGGCTLSCGGCKVTGVGNLQIYYCSRECQKADWPSHKLMCRPRQRLARAVAIIAEVWEAFEKKTFTKDHSIVSEANGVVKFQVVRRKLDPRCWSGDSIFKHFPGDDLPATVTDRVKQAMLWDQGAAEPVNTGFEILKMLLEPISAHIDEITMEVKDPALVLHCQDDAHFGSHNAVRVILPSNEVFVIDITGAQYGWEEKLYTWDTFCAHRAKDAHAGTRFGAGRQWENAVYSLERPTGLSWVLRMLRLKLVKGLEKNIEANVKAKAENVFRFLSLPDLEFASAKQHMMQQAEEYLDGAIADFSAKDIERFYFDEKFDICVTETEQQAQPLKNAWFTKEEVEGMGNETALKRAWSQRLAGSKSNA